MILYVKSLEIGEDGLGVIDPDRRDRFPAGKWRAVPPNSYWHRMAASNPPGVLLSMEAPPEEDMEGYVPPAPAADEPAVRSVPRAVKGSDA